MRVTKTMLRRHLEWIAAASERPHLQLDYSAEFGGWHLIERDPSTGGETIVNTGGRLPAFAMLCYLRGMLAGLSMAKLPLSLRDAA